MQQRNISDTDYTESIGSHVKKASHRKLQHFVSTRIHSSLNTHTVIDASAGLPSMLYEKLHAPSLFIYNDMAQESRVQDQYGRAQVLARAYHIVPKFFGSHSTDWIYEIL